MTIEPVSAIASFGVTDRQARFLVTVMLHSGVFVGRQYAAFAGITHGQKVHDFIETLLIQRFVTPIELGSTGRTKIFHVHHKPLYAAIGEPDNRNRRRVTIDRAIERLMILDGVLADRSVTWLGSERQKRHYFKQRLGDHLRDDEYPRLVFGQRPNVTVRYFPDKLPIGYDRDHRRHVFMYLACGPSPMDFRGFILRHLELLNALGFWTIRVFFPRPLARAMEAYEKAGHELLTKPLTQSQAEELLWFLRQPQPLAPDASVADRVRLQAARSAFRSPRFAAIRRHWIAEGGRAVFLAASPVARDTFDRRRASVECLELSHGYEHLFVLARQSARRRSQNRGDEALGMSGSPSAAGMRKSASPPQLRLSLRLVSELLVMHNLAAMADTERAAFFAARCQCTDVSVQALGRERPSISATRARPRPLTRGSLTLQLSIVSVVGACPASIVLRPRRPHLIWVRYGFLMSSGRRISLCPDARERLCSSNGSPRPSRH